jgi:hypothetical protein
MNRYEHRPITPGEAEIEYLDAEFTAQRTKVPGRKIDRHGNQPRGSALLECRPARALRQSAGEAAEARDQARWMTPFATSWICAVQIRITPQYGTQPTTRT